MFGKRFSLLFGFALAAIVLSSVSAPAATRYTLRPLGVLAPAPAGFSIGWSNDINNLGQVAGTSTVGTNTPGSSPYQAFLWTPESDMTSLGYLPGCGSETHGRLINNLGQVIGSTYDCSVDAVTGLTPYSFIWDPVTGIAPLFVSGAVEDFSAGGILAGSIGVPNPNCTPAGPDEPFCTPTLRNAHAWDLQGRSFDIGVLPGDGYSWAVAVNDNGQVVGFSYPVDEYGDQNGVVRGFLWSEATGIVDLSALLGATHSRAVDINNSGEILVGYTDLAGQSHYAIWSPTAGTTQLGTQIGGLTVCFDSFSDSRIAVGNCGSYHTIWSPTEGLRILQNLLDPTTSAGWTLGNSKPKVNSSGEIVVWAGDPAGNTSAILLQPNDVPDADGDGFTADVDCNDDNSAIHPGAPEIAFDSTDQDCNGYDLTIKVLSAVRRPPKGPLTVQATSGLGANAALTAVGYGPLLWVPKKKVWSKSFPTTSGSTITTVTISGVEGSVTVPVTPN